MVVRMATNMLSIDGIKVMQNERTGKFYSFSGGKISLLGLQELYLFIDNEQRAFHRRFLNKLDNLIQTLIYNE